MDNQWMPEVVPEKQMDLGRIFSGCSMEGVCCVCGFLSLWVDKEVPNDRCVPRLARVAITKQKLQLDSALTILINQ